MKITSIALALGLALVSTEARAEKLVIKGSDTLGAKFVPQLAEQFKAQNPGTTFDIAAEGSTTGIAAIIDGTAQIGMSSRRARPAEMGAASAKGVQMKPTIVAYDGLGRDREFRQPDQEPDKKQVEQIFTGDVADWSAVGGSAGKISIYTRNTSSGTYSDFKELAMKKRDYAGGSQKMAGNEQIAAEVGKNPTGSATLAWVTSRPAASGSSQSMASCLPIHRARQELSLRPPDLLLHQRRAPADWPSSSSISPLVRPAKGSSPRSDSFRSSRH